MTVSQLARAIDARALRRVLRPVLWARWWFALWRQQ